MSNPIPPFVCNTPPPIDCIADAPPPLVEDDFGDFAVVDDHQFEVSSLPVTPVHVAKLPDITPSADNKTSSPPPLSDSVYDFPPEDKDNGTSIDNNNSFTKENSTISFYPPSNSSKADVKNDLPYIIEANSPPPFEYVPEDDDDLPQCVELDDDEELDEFPPDDDMAKYDDNISLPSLKFDSLSNHSKSTTPVSEEVAKPKLEEPEPIPEVIVVDDVAEVLDVNLIVSSTDTQPTPDEELNSVPIECLNIRDELEKYDDDTNLRQLSEEQDDDFAEFEAFPAPLVSNDVTETHEESKEDEFQTTKVIEDNTLEPPVFEADFSQFSSFATESVPPPVTSQIIENNQLTEKSTLDDLEADDFDDFQDFSVPSTTTTTEQRKASVYSASSDVAEDPTEITKNSEEEGDNDNDDGDDDDFGEFSEVVESNEATSIPSSNSGFNLANLNEKLKPILEMMFPVANPNDQQEEQLEYTPSDRNDLNQLTAISQIDTAKALEHQWINSEVRHSLIKSLGVDSRNILYGEKWNSSMPRYAANLSFNPLEPMKSDKSTSSSSTSTNDYRKRSDSLTSTSTTCKTDVPAVEFDWNSSGLVNPLDASQAHTLLLDLDQLVVVANLDKINLDSSCSSPCFATPSPSSTSSLISTVPPITQTDAAACIITVKQSHADDLLAIDVQHHPPQTNDLITMSSPPSLSSSSSLLFFPPCNNSVFVTGTCRTKKCLNNFDKKPINDHANFINNTTTTTTTKTTTTTTTTNNIFANLGSNDHNFNQYLDFRVKEILHERTIETVHTTQPGKSNASVDQQSSSALKSNNTTINNSNSNNNNNIYDSDKSLRCFIDDEETISAPIEFKSNADAPVTISTAPTATTIITAATTLSGDYIDITGGDFQPSVLETNLDTITATSQVLNHNTTHAAKYQESLKTDLETESQHSGVVSTSTYAGPLKETHIFTPSKGENVLSTRSSTATTKTPRTSESKCPIDFDYEIAAAGIIIDETVVKKEYRDVEYNPGFGSKYREETIEHNHRLSPEVGLSKHIYHSNDLISSREPPRNQLDDARSLPDRNIEKMKPCVPNSSSFDDEFSDFQSVPPPAPVKVLPTILPSTIVPSSVVAEPKSSPSHWRVLKENADVSSLSSRTGTPISLNDEMILCPAILLPQAIQMESKPKIEWPEPGINPEELARIEELFPQPKGSNKPSPSHSGGRSQQQNISNRATPQLGADDDDWSDFVSVPAAPTNHIQSISQQYQKRQVSPAKSVAETNNDDEWSDFISSAPPPPQNNMRPSIYPQFNSASWQNANFYNNPMSAYASPPTSFYYQPPAAPQQNLSNNLVPNLSNLNNNTAQPPNNNIINNNNNNSINQYLINNQANHLNHHHQQHIQMMRDFSSTSPMDGGSLSSTTPSMMHHQYSMQAAPGYGYNRGFQQHHQQQQQQQHGGKPSQFGSGSSKIAPSISLIPDLGFVAPAHTSFISVPKNSFSTKK